MRPVRGIFLQSFQAFFAPCFMSDGLARNQAFTHYWIKRVGLEERDSVAYALNGSCGLIKRRLRTVPAMLKVSFRR